MSLDRAQLRTSLEAACRWLVDVAQVQGDALTVERNSYGLRHATWRGAMRGEYAAATREWDFYGPVWHTGQAVKALVLAERIFAAPAPDAASAAPADPAFAARLLDAARLGAGFLLRERVSDPADPDYGLLLAYEDVGDRANTSAILEAVDGLFVLADRTGDAMYRKAALAAVRWTADRAYLRGEGLFRDVYDPAARRFLPAPWLTHEKDPNPFHGRPLLDDAALLTASRLEAATATATGNDPASTERLRRIFFETADRLLVEEEPAGTWVRIPPCDAANGMVHPRQSYWWGAPMLDAYRASGDARYLACAERAGRWYVQAQRTDGGLFRATYTDFRTPSFGHCTSGIACAAILWQDLLATTGDESWRAPMELALAYCMRLQFTDVADPNLKGAVLEKVLKPDGTDRSPYYLRDLSTIFFVQAAAGYLARAEEAHA